MNLAYFFVTFHRLKERNTMIFLLISILLLYKFSLKLLSKWKYRSKSNSGKSSPRNAQFEEKLESLEKAFYGFKQQILSKGLPKSSIESHETSKKQVFGKTGGIMEDDTFAIPPVSYLWIIFRTQIALIRLEGWIAIGQDLVQVYLPGFKMILRGIV